MLEDCKTNIVYALLRLLGRQDWLAYGIRDRILRALVNRDKLRDLKFEIDFFGLRYPGRLDNFIEGMLFLLRDVARAMGDKPPVFLDIGANVGQHTLFMSALAKEVHAFEPYEPVRQRISEKVSRNGLTNVTIHPIGLGMQDEDRQFFRPDAFKLGIGSFMAESLKDGAVEYGKLAIRRGDDYLQDHSIGPVGLIKIDVEGLEREVLEGLRNTLRRDRPVVIVEYRLHARDSVGLEEELRDIFGDDMTFFIIEGMISPYRLKGLEQLSEMDVREINLAVLPTEMATTLAALDSV